MKFLLVLISFIFFAQVFSFDVPELTVAELEAIAFGDTKEPWMIKFYGPNCGFCKGMASEWEAFAQMVAEEDLDLKVGSFNVHESENQVESIRNLMPGPLPGIHFFPPGDKKFYEYPNPRINTNKDFYLNFALFEFEDFPGVHRKPEYLYEEESPIVAIDGNNLDKFIEENEGKPVFVYFFGPKCGWCKEKLPLWTQFAEESKERNAPWIVARIDGFSNMQVIERYKARPWPSMVYIDNGRFYRLDTDVGRQLDSTDQLFNWIESGEYLEVDEEFKGEDKGYLRYLKIKEAKDKSRDRKKQRENEEL